MCVILMASLLSTSCGRDPEAAKRAYLESGNAYFAAEKYPEALLEYRNAVQQDPRFGEARYKLAQTYERVDDPVNAYREYVRAADLMPEDGDVQLRAGQMLLAAGKLEDARARADALLAKDPRNGQALVLRGLALAGLNDFDGGITQMEEAIRVDPGNSDTYGELGALQLGKGDHKSAETAFRRAVEIDSTSAPARRALGMFYLSAGRVAEGEAALKATLQLDASDLPANRALALIHLASNRATDAEPYLKEVVEISKTTAARLALADYYAAARRWDDAIQTLQSIGSDDQPGLLASRTRLAAIQQASGHASEARQTLKDVLAQDPKYPAALILNARFLMGERRLDDAMAQARAATNADPHSASAHFELGKIYAATDQLDEAATAFREVLKLNPRAAAAEYELARVHLSRGQVDAAIQFARQALQHQPESSRIRLLLVETLVASGNVAQAEHELKTLLVRYPSVSAVHSQAAVIYLAKNDRAAAKRAFEQAQRLDRLSFEALAGLVSLDIAARRVADARARVETRLTETPDDARVLILAAKVYAGGGDTTRTEQVLRHAIATDPSNLEAFAMLGHLFVAVGKLDQAKAEFDAIATRRPGTASATSAQTMVGLLLHMQNRLADAQKQYERILAASPRALIAANNLAWLYADQGINLDVALGLAQTAVQQAPDRPELTDTLGWVYYKKNLQPLATAAFQRCVEKEPSNPLYHYHLGLAYAKSGEPAKARQSLEKALALDPNFAGSSEARRLLASIAE
jgi:putative PEP-CTERM system TPR-repeat lipoprotein